MIFGQARGEANSLSGVCGPHPPALSEVSKVIPARKPISRFPPTNTFAGMLHADMRGSSRILTPQKSAR